jgi:hypothetical protein
MYLDSIIQTWTQSSPSIHLSRVVDQTLVVFNRGLTKEALVRILDRSAIGGAFLDWQSEMTIELKRVSAQPM